MNWRKKRTINFIFRASSILALSIIIMILLGSLSGITGADEEPVNLGNIFTFDKLTVDGDVVDEGDVIEIDEDTQIFLFYDWNTEDLDVDAKNGDYAEIAVPEAFTSALPGDFTDDIVVTLDGESTKVGKYTLKKETNILRFEFDAGIEGIEVRNGFVGFGIKFETAEFTENTTQVISFEDTSSKELTITLKPEVIASDIDKVGVPGKDGDSPIFVDATELSWTIDIFNTEVDTITDVTVSDVIPEGLALEEGSITVHKLMMGYGDVVAGQAAVSQGDVYIYGPSDLTVNTSDFQLEFGEILPFSGYRIEYTTTITDFIKTTFTNSAILSYKDKNLLAEATVDGLTRSALVEKTGVKVNGEDKIIWTVDVNKPGIEIGNAIIEDDLIAGLTLAGEPLIKQYLLTQQGEEWVADENVSGTFSEFPIELGTIASNEAYRIIFVTEVEYPEIFQESTTFSNTVILKDGENPLEDDTAEVTIERPPILRKESTVDLSVEVKIITWTIYVNEANHPITDGLVTDQIPAGLNFSTDDVVVFKNDVIVALDAGKITYDGNTLTIDLGEINTDEYKIIYTTEIEDFSVGKSFENVAGLTGDGVGEDVTDTSTSTPDDNTYTKTFKSINYTNKTITWEIEVNPKKDPIKSLTITDTFPNGGMILLPDTVVVKHGSSTLSLGTDYTLEQGTEEGVTV
jgi:uncharacterized repeat protein (TIGR01451 family)